MATKINTFLERVNKTLVYKKITELEIGQKYSIEKLDFTNGQFGKTIKVTTAEFYCYLPVSWTGKFTDADLKDINNELKNGTGKMSLTYNGTTKLDGGRCIHYIELS